MNNVFDRLLKFSVFVLVVAGVAGFNGPTAQPCEFNLTKVAPGGGDTLFVLEISWDGSDPGVFPVSDGAITQVEFKSNIIAFELPTDGWTLADIQCGSEGATGFEITDNGVTAGCDGGGSVSCTFTNVSVANVPTLSEWGMISAAAGLGLAGVFFAMRKRLRTSNGSEQATIASK